MITLKEDTTLVGVSELRTKIDQVLDESRTHKVLIGRRNKPVAVLMAVEKYNEMEEILDLLEDTALGLLAKARESKSKPSDYWNLEDVEKKVRRK